MNGRIMYMFQGTESDMENVEGALRHQIKDLKRSLEETECCLEETKKNL
jgi:hypothetical protein